jgi:hypothetical protein
VLQILPSNLYKRYTLTSPRSQCVGRTNAQTVPEIQEELRGEPFGHDVGELQRRGDMENPYLTERHLLPDKVDVDLDMLSTAVLNRVRGHVDCTDVVTKDNGGRVEGVM